MKKYECAFLVFMHVLIHTRACFEHTCNIYHEILPVQVLQARIHAAQQAATCIFWANMWQLSWNITCSSPPSAYSCCATAREVSPCALALRSWRGGGLVLRAWWKQSLHLRVVWRRRIHARCQISVRLMYVWMYVCMYVCIYIYICVCVCVCVYI